jgi:DNA repair protein RecN (Recombination protein N)
MADRHFRVDKHTIIQETGAKSQESEVRTVVRVTSLDTFTTRREELATLTGGKSVNEAIAFAESLLAQAADRRQFQPANSNLTAD